MGHNKSTDHFGKCLVYGEQMKPVETPTESQDDLMDLAAKVYDRLPEEELDEVEGLALNRGEFFNQRLHEFSPTRPRHLIKQYEESISEEKQ